MNYEIGQKLTINNNDFLIIDKRINPNKKHTKQYKYKCMNCGYDCGEYYYSGIFHKENWVEQLNGCACCNGRYCVPGINDIYTTDKWMVDYLLDHNDSKKYRSKCNKKISMRCVNCGSEKICSIQKLQYTHKIGCECEDGISIPNKFSYYVFQQLSNQLSYYEREYSPSWAKRYKYDNYFEKDEERYILELDGYLGHGKKTYHGESDVFGLSRDLIKNDLAKEHNIKVIRIDIPFVNNSNYLNTIKYKMIDSLCEIFDFNNIDWDFVFSKTYSNLIKEVCNFYSIKYQKNINNYNCCSELGRIFNLNPNTIRKYLYCGNDLGWCNYISYFDNRKTDYQKIVNYYNAHTNITLKDISKELNYKYYYVKSIIHEAILNKDIDYIKIVQPQKNHCKKVYVRKCDELVKVYESYVDCDKNSFNDLGFKISKKILNSINNNTRKTNKCGDYIVEFE